MTSKGGYSEDDLKFEMEFPEPSEDEVKKAFYNRLGGMAYFKQAADKDDPFEEVLPNVDVRDGKMTVEFDIPGKGSGHRGYRAKVEIPLEGLRMCLAKLQYHAAAKQMEKLRKV